MSKYSRDVQTRFLSDVVEHRMKVHMDTGVYRHLECSKPGTNCYRFDITTWPGYLCVTGDMGTWTFSRLRDMFEFFGGAFEHGINTGYWSEKFEAGSGCNRELICKDYDHDSFCADLLRWQNDYLEVDEDAEPEEDEDWDDDDATPDSDEARIREIVRELTRGSFSNEHEAYQALYEANWPSSVSAWDICEGITFKTYTDHFRWILFAIVWGIGRYYNTRLVDRSMTTFLAFNGVATNG